MSYLEEILHNIIYRGLEKYGRYYSIYPAYVFDNDDPSSMGRLRLIIPHISATSPLQTWAVSRNMFSGGNYGSHVIPELNSMVWVEFFKGDPRVPIWSHSYHASGRIEDSRLRSVRSYWFKSPNGHLAEINDAENEIVLSHSEGSKATISSDTILIEHKDGSIFEITPDGINIGQGTMEPVVLGTQLVTILNELITALETLTVGTAFGPSSVPLNVAALTAVKGKLNQILSQLIKIS